MASSASIKTGEGHIELGVSMAGLTAGLKAAEAKLKAWGAGAMQAGASISAMGAAIMAPFLKGLHVFADLGSEMLDASQRTGVSVEALSELGYAAEQSGASMEVLERGFVGMNRLIDEAVGGSREATERLERLGLSVDDLSKLSQDQRLELFAEKISQIEDPAQRAAAAMSIFGKSGSKLLPMMSDGAAGVKALREEAIRLGVSMTSEDAAKAEALGDQFSSVGKQFKMMWFHIGAAVAPIAKEFMTAVQEIAATTIGWIRDNRELLSTVFQVGVGLTVLGGVITGVGVALYGAGAALGVVSSVLGIVGFVAGTVFSLAALKIGIVVGAIALAGYGLHQLTGLFTGMGDGLQSFFGTFRQIWEGVAAAVGGGNLAEAWSIVCLGMELQWKTTVLAMTKQWDDMIKNLRSKVPDIFNTQNATAQDRELQEWAAFEFIPRLNQAEADAARDEALRAAWPLMTAGQGIAGSSPEARAVYDRALQDAINRQYVAEANRVGYPVPPLVTVQGGRVISGGGLENINDQRAGIAGPAETAAEREIRELQKRLDDATFWAEYDRQVRINTPFAGFTPPPGLDTAPKVPGFSSLGTFSGSAIAGMFGGKDKLTEIADRQLGVQEELLQEVRNGGMQWA